MPVDGPVALFFRKDLTEPKLQLVIIHARILTEESAGVPNADQGGSGRHQRAPVNLVLQRPPRAERDAAHRIVRDTHG